MGAYTQRYFRNRLCTCPRCRIRCAMGPAIMITIGVLFLLQTMNVMRFHYTWPVILIVIGVLQVAAHSAPATGHLQPGWYGAPVATPPAAQAPPTASSGEAPTQGGAGGSNV